MFITRLNVHFTPHVTSHKSYVKSKEKNAFGLVRAQQTKLQFGGKEFKLDIVEDTKYTDLTEG